MIVFLSFVMADGLTEAIHVCPDARDGLDSSVENAFMISGKPLKKRRDRVGSSGIRRMDVVCVTFCCGQKKVERA